MDLYTVYYNSTDYPNRYVVRRFTIRAQGWTADWTPLAVADTLEDVRQAIPPGLHCLPRDPHDEPQIVEVWL